MGNVVEEKSLAFEVRADDQPDPNQGHSREWPSTPYSDETLAKEPPSERSCCIALLGDCTVSCDQWSPANRPDNHLRVRLRRAFPGQNVVVRNFGDAGGTARSFLESGGLDRALAELPRMDVAFLRYGINDRKADGIAGCIGYLRAVCEHIKAACPDVTIFIETNMWVDYPRHYVWDRNARLAPLYEAMRRFAAEAGYPLVDVFAKMEAETRRGNWDLRIRGVPGGTLDILDDSFDRFYGDDPAFFSNIHPNSRCLGLIADWEVAALKDLFGEALPHAGKAEKGV
jgi:acyl-CoA thioesterase-1